jgi:hypothetical protein
MPLRSRTALPPLTVQAWAPIFNNIIEFQTMQDLFFNQNISEKEYSDFIVKIDLPSLIQSMRFLLGENPDDYLINKNPMAPSHLQLFLTKLGINQASFDSIFGFIQITRKR